MPGIPLRLRLRRTWKAEVKKHSSHVIEYNIIKKKTVKGERYLKKGKCPFCQSEITQMTKKPEKEMDFIVEHKKIEEPKKPHVINYDPEIKVIDQRIEKKESFTDKVMSFFKK